MMGPKLGQIVHYVSKDPNMTVHAAIIVMTKAEWTPALHTISGDGEGDSENDDWFVRPTSIEEPGDTRVHLAIFGAGSIYWEMNVPMLDADRAAEGDYEPRHWFYPPGEDEVPESGLPPMP